MARALINRLFVDGWCRVVHDAPMNTPPTQNIRLTITVTPEVHEVFQRFSKAAGMSLGRAMGEWLADTVEAAEFTASKMEQARAAPKVVMREMHAYALGLADETEALMEQIRQKGKSDRVGASVARTPGQTSRPPSSNTGGKGPESTKAHGGKRSESNPIGVAQVQAYADTNGIRPASRLKRV